MRSIALAAALCVSTAAHAESRAWTAAKKVLPSGLTVVAGLNYEKFRGTPLFAQQWQSTIGRHDLIVAMKDTCSIDLTAQVESVALGLDSDRHGAIVLALKTGQKQVDACYGKLAKAAGKTTAPTKAGALTKYPALEDGKPDLFLRWLGTNIAAIASSPEDKDELEKFTAGGFAKDKAVAGQLASVHLDAPLWVLVHSSQALGVVPATMSMAYGHADVKNDTIAVEAHFVVESAKAATESAAQLDQQLAKMKSGGLPGSLDAVIKSVAVKTSGSELIVTGAATQDQLMALAALATH
jgi:hypothetical protein